jgi:hypothetical protein
MNDQEKSIVLAKAMGNDQEKSIVLAKAMGWEIGEIHGADRILLPEGGNCKLDALYNTACMALAWRVHLWALHRAGLNGYETWWHKYAPWMKEDAQRLWLDKILSLFMEIA